MDGKIHRQRVYELQRKLTRSQGGIGATRTSHEQPSGLNYPSGRKAGHATAAIPSSTVHQYDAGLLELGFNGGSRGRRVGESSVCDARRLVVPTDFGHAIGYRASAQFPRASRRARRPDGRLLEPLLERRPERLEAATAGAPRARKSLRVQRLHGTYGVTALSAAWSATRGRAAWHVTCCLSCLAGVSTEGVRSLHLNPKQIGGTNP